AHGSRSHSNPPCVSENIGAAILAQLAPGVVVEASLRSARPTGRGRRYYEARPSASAARLPSICRTPPPANAAPPAVASASAGCVTAGDYARGRDTATWPRTHVDCRCATIAALESGESRGSDYPARWSKADSACVQTMRFTGCANLFLQNASA